MKEKTKDALKKNLPQPVKDVIISGRNIAEQLVIFNYDKRRFLGSYSKTSLRKNSQPQLSARLTFHAHALEKGMSHAEVRLGFGMSALKQLARCMSIYNALAYSKADKGYENALSVLQEYMALHDAKEFNITYLNDLFSAGVLQEVHNTTSALGGIKQFSSLDKKSVDELNFKDLFENRWSVREYADTLVDKSKINEAIAIAMKSPSICNRQSSHVTVVTNPAKIEQAMKVQGGMTGYKMPPVLLMVTTDTSAFVHVTERNQVYIDGGLFAMSLLLGLEYVSLAACPLNAMLSVARDKKMRKILDIPSNENIIMFISVGNFKDENKVPKSFRYTGEDVTRVVC